MRPPGNTDLEAGAGPSASNTHADGIDNNNNNNNGNQNNPASGNGNGNGNGNSNSQLERYRTLIGISKLPPQSRRAGANVGLYHRLIDAELKTRVEYYTTASIINGCLIGQIVIAAALTALGAANGSHVAITILGAVNTVIAGFMTYLKGQGLPNRLLDYCNSLRRVREYAENRERRFMVGDSTLDADDEADVIEAMYDNARRTAEENYPSAVKSIVGTLKKVGKGERMEPESGEGAIALPIERGSKRGSDAKELTTGGERGGN